MTSRRRSRKCSRGRVADGSRCRRKPGPKRSRSRCRRVKSGPRKGRCYKKVRRHSRSRRKSRSRCRRVKSGPRKGRCYKKVRRHSRSHCSRGRVKGGSRCKRKPGPKRSRSGRMGWINALRRARKELGLEDTYVTINRGVNGVALYKRACEIYGNRTKNCQAATGMAGPTPRRRTAQKTKEEKKEDKKEEKKERKAVKKIKKAIEKGSDVIQKTSKKMAKSLLNQVKESMAIPEVQKGVLVTALGALAVAGARSDKGQQAIQTLTQKLPDMSGVPAHIKQNIRVFLNFIKKSKGKLQDLATNVASTISGGAGTLALARRNLPGMARDRATRFVRDRGVTMARDRAERVLPGLFKAGAGSSAQDTFANLQAQYASLAAAGRAARSGTGGT